MKAPPPSQSYSLILIATINTTASPEGRASDIIIVGDSHKKKAVKFVKVAC
jgi:hypothetical protein